MEYKKIEPSQNEKYEVALDDHCLVVKVGDKIMHLSEAMCDWISVNKQHIDFKNDEWTANIEEKRN